MIGSQEVNKVHLTQEEILTGLRALNEAMGVILVWVICMTLTVGL